MLALLLIPILTFAGTTTTVGHGDETKIASPKWVTTQWVERDPFAGGWQPYAKLLREHPSYFDNSGWTKKAEIAATELKNHPGDAWALYKASAAYLVACEFDWRLGLPGGTQSPIWRTNTNPTWGKIYQGWLEFPRNLKSKEFCRIGFAICAPEYEFDAGALPDALLKEFPKDRLAISSAVWYSSTHSHLPMDKVLRFANQLPSLPNARLSDYLTLALADGVWAIAHNDVKLAIAHRDALVKYCQHAPLEMAKRLQRDIRGANAWIKQHGG